MNSHFTKPFFFLDPKIINLNSYTSTQCHNRWSVLNFFHNDSFFFSNTAGMQNYVIRTGEPWGLPLDLQLLPQHLKNLGYSTHAVGKWHLGMFQKDYLPLQRGFDSFLGYTNGFIDYYSHKHISVR